VIRKPGTPWARPASCGTPRSACWSHPNKAQVLDHRPVPRKFSKFRTDRWVSGDKDTRACLPKPSWTDIVRHTLVKGGASPDDPALAGYWAQRRQKVKPRWIPTPCACCPGRDGRCSLCGENLLTPDQPPKGWEHWFLRVTKKAITADYLVHHDTPSAARTNRTHLVYATCHPTKHSSRLAGNTVLQQTA
jgi:RNA-directed DNA polymerase